MPIAATSSVLRRPTQNARPKVEVLAEYGISVWLMSKPAVLFQKPKPEAMWARARLCAALTNGRVGEAADDERQSDLNCDAG